MFVWLLFVFLYNSWGSHGKYTGVVDYFLLLKPWNLKTIASWQENYDKPRQCVEKQKHYSANEGLYSQDYGLSSGHTVVSCESWTVKKAEHQRIDVFRLWCWRRLLRVTWTARRSNQSILREINPVYSFKGLMMKLKLQ